MALNSAIDGPCWGMLCNVVDASDYYCEMHINNKRNGGGQVQESSKVLMGLQG